MSESNALPDDSFAATSDELITALYDELHVIARREHRRAGRPQTLQTTALIGEAYVKLKRRDNWQSERHFLACAATTMRHILIDAARARMAAKRGPDEYAYTQSLDAVAATATDDEVVRLGDALQALATIDANLVRVVDCRFFAGYDEKETANVLGVSDRTVRRWWVQARALIHHEMAA